MGDKYVDIGGNDLLRVEESPDGPYIALYPLEWNKVGYGNAYPVVIEQLSDGKWFASVPKMPHITATANTRARVKSTLAEMVKEYLRQRVAYIRGAESLVRRYIINTDGRDDPTTARIAGINIPVWQFIDGMDEAFVASSRGDDNVLLDVRQMKDAQDTYDLPEEAVRAAIAYYLDHKWDIRNRIVHERKVRLDAGFARLQEESGLTEEELSSLLGAPIDHVSR